MTPSPTRIRRGRRRRVAVLLLVALAGIRCDPGERDLHSQAVAPGIWHHQVHLVRGPWRIHVLEIDLARARAAGYHLRAASLGDGRLGRTSELAAGALAGINGDFYGGDREHPQALGLQVQEGCMRHPPGARSALVFTCSGQPLIARFRMQAAMQDAGGVAHAVTAFGRGPAPGDLSLYSTCMQTRGDTVRAGFGFQLQALERHGAVNDTVHLRVQQVRRQAWPLLLDAHQWLVAVGAAHPAALQVDPGDTVALSLGIVPEDGDGALRGRVCEAIGGGPRLLRNGGVAVEYAQERLSEAFAADRHPRTAVGYSRDGTILFLLTVDGRQPGYSVGMSLAELADFMGHGLADVTRSGTVAHQALNLDGGGSTTMVINRQVVNSPSDQTGERLVANALLVVGPGAEAAP